MFCRSNESEANRSINSPFGVNHVEGTSPSPSMQSVPQHQHNLPLPPSVSSHVKVPVEGIQANTLEGDSHVHNSHNSATAASLGTGLESGNGVVQPTTS